MKSILTFLFFFALTSCQSAQERENLPPKNIKSSSERCLCPMIYLPVCGEDKKTYSNSCSAKCAGVAHKQGACEDINFNIKK